MKIIRKTNILVKTIRKSKTFLNSDSEKIILCPQCGKKMHEAQNAANILKIGLRQLYQMVETNRVHFLETEEKTGFLCLSSIKEKKFS